MNNMTTLGKLLERKRQHLCLAQKDIANIFGCSIREYRRWCQGKCVPQPYYRGKIRDLLDLSPETLDEVLDEQKSVRVESGFLLPAKEDITHKASEGANLLLEEKEKVPFPRSLTRRWHQFLFVLLFAISFAIIVALALHP